MSRIQVKHTRENFHQDHDINESLFFLTQAVARRMVNEKVKGSIVNIGSMWAKRAIKATPSSAYSMANAGLHSLTQHLAMELSDCPEGTEFAPMAACASGH